MKLPGPQIFKIQEDNSVRILNFESRGIRAGFNDQRIILLELEDRGTYHVKKNFSSEFSMYGVEMLFYYFALFQFQHFNTQRTDNTFHSEFERRNRSPAGECHLASTMNLLPLSGPVQKLQPLPEKLMFVKTLKNVISS